MRALASTLALLAAAHAHSAHEPLHWHTDYDRLVGMWRGEHPRGHVYEALFERPRKGIRRVTLCTSIVPGRYSVVTGIMNQIVQGTRYRNERYVRGSGNLWPYGGVEVWFERENKPLRGMTDSAVSYLEPAPQGVALQCLHRVDRTARPERTEREAAWRPSAAQPLIGYWSGTVRSTGGWYENKAHASTAVTHIDEQDRATGVLCTGPAVAEEHVNIVSDAVPFGPKEDDVPGSAQLVSTWRFEPPWGSRIETPEARYPKTLRVLSGIKMGTGPPFISAWWLTNASDDEVQIEYYTEAEGQGSAYDLHNQAYWSGEMRRTEGPDGCLKMLTPMVPVMPTAEEAHAGTESPAQKIRERSNGRWRERAG